MGLITKNTSLMRDVVKDEQKAIRYFKLKSEYEGDDTKDYGLLGEEVDKNFYFLRGRDIKSVVMDENRTLIIERVDGNIPPIKINIGDKLGKPSFEYIEDEGKIKITYPDGVIEYVDGFYVHERDYVFAIDESLDGKGSIYEPLRLSSLEKTGSFAPANEYIDLTDGKSSLPISKAHGYRIITKEIIEESGYVYSIDDVLNLQKELIENHSQWRIPTKDDWDELLNVIEHAEDRNHNSEEINVWLGKYAGVGLKSVENWTEYDEPIDEEITNGLDIFGLNILPVGIITNQNIEGIGDVAGVWTLPMEKYNNKPYIKLFQFDKTGVKQDVANENTKVSIRLIKDYNKINYKEIENILGSLYPTKLITYTHEGLSYSKIWTEINFYSNVNNLKGVKVKSSYNENEGKVVYFINECYINENNECSWSKKLLKDGDSIVIANYNNEALYHEWRIVNNELVDPTEIIINSNENITLLSEKLEKTNETVTKLENTFKNEKVLDVDYDANSKNIRLKFANGEVSEGFSSEYFIINGTLKDIVYEEESGLLKFIWLTVDGEKTIDVHISKFFDVSEINNRIKELENTIKNLNQTIKGVIKNYVTGLSKEIKIIEENDQLKIGFDDDAIFGEINPIK